MAPRARRLVAPTLLAVAVALSACAASPPPVTPGPTTGAPAADVAKPQEPAQIPSTAPAKAPEAPPQDTAPKPPADAPKPGQITMDDDDGCTKIAAAFEQKARPKIKECYREGKKANAALEGSVRITLQVDGFGKLGQAKAQEATLPDAVVKCMVKAVHDTPFDDASKCKRKGITLPIQFPSK
ncbi:MAG: hypothetical protein U0183_18525 [Polyangiaceae bacterium]